MEAKDKAQSLFLFYYETIPYAHTNKQRAEVAKKCALKAIDEMLGVVDESMLFKQSKREWYRSVKEWIQNIK